MKRLVQSYLKRLGVTVKRDQPPRPTKDMSPEFAAIYAECKEFTMTSVARMYGLFESIKYVVDRELPGDIVECGVWRGGSCMLIAKYLANRNDTSRQIYLYDTFAGMSAPTECDREIATNTDARSQWQVGQNGEMNEWCFASLEVVRANMSLTGYPEDKLTLVQGKVEDSIPATIPEQISLLRLDTDWYESTLHELKHLYPRLIQAGVLILDDYGHWAGARQAVDEYFEEQSAPLLLNRIDFSGRVAVKV